MYELYLLDSRERERRGEESWVVKEFLKTFQRYVYVRILLAPVHLSSNICLVFLKSQRQCFMASNKVCFFPHVVSSSHTTHRIQMTIKIAFIVLLNFIMFSWFYYFHCLLYMHYNFIHVYYNRMPLFTSIHPL